MVGRTDIQVFPVPIAVIVPMIGYFERGPVLGVFVVDPEAMADSILRMLLVPCVYALFEDIRAKIYTPEALKRHEEELAMDANEHALENGA